MKQQRGSRLWGMRVINFFFLLILAACAQAQSAAPTAIVPISKEAHHHLVLENEYVRVYSVEVPPHSETLFHQHDLDYVFVTLGDSDVENVRVGEKPVRLQLKDGEVRFTRGGFAHKAVNNSDKPFRNVTVELKKSNPARGEFSCFTCGMSQRYTGSTGKVLIDNGKVRVLRLRPVKGYSMGLQGMPHVMRLEGLLLVMNFSGTIYDMGTPPATGPGCPCPSKNVQVGDVFWIEDDHRYDFYSPPHNVNTELITIETYVPPKSKQ